MEGTDPMLGRVTAAAEPVLWAMAAGNPADLQEVPDLLGRVQEKVLAQHRAGRQIESLEQYAKQAARNTFNDWLRSKRRQREHVAHDLGASSFSTPLVVRITDRAARTPSSLVADQEEQRHHAPLIQAAWESLTSTERAVLELRYLQELPSGEVAAILGYKSAAVVDTTASRARRKLSDRLPPSVMASLLGP